MRILIMGTGGVGGYFGGRLAASGCDVGFVARGDHLDAMRKEGLRVESPLGGLHLPSPQASADPAELGPADVILICVKLWDTEAALRAILPVVGPETAVISLQNGVEKDDLLRGALGTGPVVGGLCYISAEILRPGIIRHSGITPRLLFGEYDASLSPRTSALLACCQAGGIEASVPPDIRSSIWEKFVFLVGVSALTTIMDAPIGSIRADPRARALLLDVMREVVAVGRVRGVTLDQEFAQDRLSFCDTLPPDTTSSMHRDFRRGRRLEVGWLSGAVAKLGKASGIEAPLNRAVNDILDFRAAARAGPTE